MLAVQGSRLQQVGLRLSGHGGAAEPSAPPSNPTACLPSPHRPTPFPLTTCFPSLASPTNSPDTLHRCVWPLFWWGKPWGRAFEMAMCILRARQSGWPKPELDFGQCTMRCTPSEVAWKIHVPRRRGGEGAALALEAAGEGQESGLPGVVDLLPDGQAW